MKKKQEEKERGAKRVGERHRERETEMRKKTERGSSGVKEGL